MSEATGIADHWGQGDVYALIVAALAQAGKPLDGLSVEDLAPIDHYHARGFAATVELADRLAFTPEMRGLDIGCGIGGPARYIATRFGCRVSGIDITLPFVEAARKLTALLRLEGQVDFMHGDGRTLPYPTGTFDAAYAQHVTMNVADRARFFAEAFRVLKPGGVFALSEHGLGQGGTPHFPVPWSMDGRFSYLCTPAKTEALLRDAGFANIVIESTGAKYLAAYRQLMALAAEGKLPPLGLHVLIGETAGARTRNAARNIEEGRTEPVQVFCRKPS